ncbi:hypothetical protein ACFVDT_06415 [Streptomyces sp. NPDC057699]|uniref:Secreted protein n=1 Tax=Streptomyces sp. NBC_00148 TaxID=2903626 RepID=A0AAU1LQ35_9ACTN
MSLRGSLRHHRFIGTAVSLSATAALAACLSACSGDGKGDDAAGKAYTVPTSLCGKAGVGKTTSCTSSAHPEQDLYAVIQVLDSGIDDRAAMKSLLTDYTEAVERSSACR